MSNAKASDWAIGVPTDWAIPQLWTQCRRFAEYGANIPAADYAPNGVRFLRTSDIAESGKLRESKAVYIPSTYAEGYRLQDGDVLFSRSGTLGRSFVYDEAIHEPCSYAGYLVLYRPKPHLSSRFLFYFTKSKAFGHWLRTNTIESTIGNVSGQKFSSMRISRPPLPTQRAIASFLDRETEKIDTLIEKKRRLLELLEEKRTALITQAVIRGLDPDVPMKDSGVEWLGEIPEHWEVRQIRHLCPPTRPIIYGIVLPGPDVPDGVSLIKGGDVDHGRLRPELLNRTTYEIDAKHARSRVAPGDVVYSIRGSFGAAAIVPIELHGANLTQDAARVSPRRWVDSRWLRFVLTSEPIKAEAEAGALGATIKGVNIRDLRRLRLPTPPGEEQERIAGFLAEEEARFADIRDRVTDAISLLQEYRTALISAAVTGKINVRDRVSA